LFTTVGFVCYDGPEGLILTDTWGDGQIGPRDQIPRGMIREIQVLTPAPAGQTKKAKN
jgi:hypothetical protein